MKRKIITIILVLVLLSCLTIVIPSNVQAATFDRETETTANDLVNHILGDGLTAQNPVKKGTVYTFSNGTNDIGINSGIILDTSGIVPNTENDSDLLTLMNYPYGGDTASLEFTITSTGTLLNFNYVFGSGEFTCGEQFNDVFGLFVSVNDGAYENIAKITRNDGSQVPVNISNLKSGLSGNELNGNPVEGTAYSLFTAKSVDGISVNGISNVFNAQKKVNKGDKVKIKFVIADVSDTSVDSYVMIEAGSLSFNAPGAKIDYSEEYLKELEPNTAYKIIDGSITYELKSDEDGKIALVGKDNNNKSYNFIGKEVQIIKKGEGDIADSEPQDLVIDNRPEKPEDVSNLTETPKDIEVDDIEIKETEIKILAKKGQEYSIDKTTWKVADEDGYVVFNNLTPNKEYTVYTRYEATESAFASETTSGTKVITKNMVKNLNYKVNNFVGESDGDLHYAFITCEVEGVEIKYSETLNGTYSSDVIKFRKPGTYTVYYSISKEGYYPAFGTLTVTITGKGIIGLADSKNVNNTKIADSEKDLISKIEFTDEDLELVENGKSIDIYLEVNDISDSVSAEDKSKIEEKLGSNELGIYLDISLFKKVEGQEKTKITKTKEPITISFEIPENLLNTDSNVIRTFKIFRLHDGVISEIDVKVNGKIATFETDEFSTYALTYADTKVELLNPKTGDNIAIWISLMVVSMLGIAGTVKFVKKNK